MTPHKSGFQRAMEALDNHGVPRVEAGPHGRRLSLVERIDLMGSGRTVPPLVGATESAQLLGVETSNLSRVANFPAPVAVLTRGSLYLRSEVEALAAARKARRA